jgi:hypothetical protein
VALNAGPAVEDGEAAGGAVAEGWVGAGLTGTAVAGRAAVVDGATVVGRVVVVVGPVAGAGAGITIGTVVTPAPTDPSGWVDPQPAAARVKHRTKAPAR